MSDRRRSGVKPGAASRSVPERVFAEAQRHHAAGRLEEAQALYRRVLALAPGHVKALHYLGAALGQSGAFAEGEALSTICGAPPRLGRGRAERRRKRGTNL